MANLRDVKPRVKTITLNDGVEREIRFTLNAMAEIEDKYGSIEAGFAKLDEGSIKAARFIMWAGLMHSDENLTEQQVGNLIDMQCLQDIFSEISDAIKEDIPNSTEENGEANLEALPNA